MSRRRWAGAIGIVVAAAVAFQLLTAAGRAEADGEGVLASLGKPGFESMAVDPQGQANGATWTFGLRLCTESGSPARLGSVGPTAAVGSGFRVLGSYVRTFTQSVTHEPIIGVQPFPPHAADVPDPLVPATGSTVQTRCDAGPDGPYTELLIGMELTSREGGGWQGITVDYDADGRHRTVQFDHNLLICGTAIPTACAGPGG